VSDNKPQAKGDAFLQCYHDTLSGKKQDLGWNETWKKYKTLGRMFHSKKGFLDHLIPPLCKIEKHFIFALTRGIEFLGGQSDLCPS
jgi:hypothetical protein